MRLNKNPPEAMECPLQGMIVPDDISGSGMSSLTHDIGLARAVTVISNANPPCGTA